MINTPSVLAVMVNYNGQKYLVESIPSCLKELSRYNGKLVVIDNNSNDSSVEYITTRFPAVHVYQTGSNLGGSGGFNTGMRLFLTETTFHFVWLLDNDIIIEPGALEALLDALKYQHIGAAGSQICLYDYPEIIQEIGGGYTSFLGALVQHYSGKDRLHTSIAAFPVDYLAACSLLIQRDCLQDVGLFNDFFVSYDDVDWGLRANKKGWKLLAVPGSIIRHQYNKYKPLSPIREYFRKRNRLILLMRHPPVYTGYITCMIYLLFLNFRIFYSYFTGNVWLSKALKLAREHALVGRLGNLDENDWKSLVPETTSLPKLKHNYSILIDIMDDPGAELSIIKEITSKFDYKGNLYARQIDNLPQHSSRHTKSPPAGMKYDKVIIGDTFHFSSLMKGKQLYKYNYGKYRKIKTPFMMILRTVLARVFATTGSLAVSPFHFLIMMANRRKITNTEK